MDKKPDVRITFNSNFKAIIEMIFQNGPLKLFQSEILNKKLKIEKDKRTTLDTSGFLDQFDCFTLVTINISELNKVFGNTIIGTKTLLRLVQSP